MSRCRSGKFRGNLMLERVVSNRSVGMTVAEVQSDVRSHLRKGVWDSWSRADQRSFDCEVKRVHERNQRLYRDVMGGRF